MFMVKSDIVRKREKEKITLSEYACHISFETDGSKQRIKKSL